MNLRRWTKGLIDELRRDKSGVTALEYALVGLFVFLACVAAIKTYTIAVNTMYGNISSNLV